MLFGHKKVHSPHKKVQDAHYQTCLRRRPVSHGIKYGVMFDVTQNCEICCYAIGDFDTHGIDRLNHCTIIINKFKLHSSSFIKKINENRTQFHFNKKVSSIII